VPWQQLLAGVAAEKAAEATGAERDNSSIDSAAVEFRYRYDLITAEETERWLDLRAVSLGDFSDYFARAYWRENLDGRAAVDGVPFHEASGEFRELLAIELILSGEFDRMAERLAWRVAAAENASVTDTEVERRRLAERTGLGVDDTSVWLSSLGRDEAWLEEMLVAEAAFRAHCEKLLTPEAAEREISALRLPLTRFDVETIEFESHDAASEAVWCVRTDGMSMSEVAQEGRYPYRRAELVLEDIPDDLQQKFLSLTPGSILDPIPREDGFQLSRLLGKAEPNTDDPQVRARIEQRILDRHFAELASKHVRWEITPVSAE
jgi:hypothetical protein